MEEVNQIVKVETLPAEAQQKARDIASGIEFTDSQAVLQYGVGAQTNISDFSDTILSEVRSKDTGYVGEILSDLVVNINDMKVGDLSSDPGMFKKLKRKIKRFIAQFDKTSVQIEKILNRLEEARMTLLKDVTMLDSLYEKNQEYLAELDIFIAAGQIKLQEVKATLLPEMQAQAEASDDPADAQKLQDLNQAIHRFEKKLNDLKLSRMISIQTGPQVRLVQNGNSALVEKIQSSIVNTIPLWKNQIVISISLFRQKGALEMQKEITKTTNDLLAKNSEMLKQGTLDIAKESERGIVEIETLQKVNQDLISTIEETLTIQKEGRDKRILAEQELIRMEGELKAQLKKS